MKKKILYIITKGNWGGAQRYVYDLATSLPDQFEPVVAVGEHGYLAEKLSAKGVRVIDVPHLTRDIFFFRELAALYHLVTIIRSEKPDIVHLNSSKAGGLGALACRIARVPRIIYTAHGWPFREERLWVVQAAIAVLSWATLILSHKTIVLSAVDYAHARKWPFSRKLELIPNGVRANGSYDAGHARRILQSEYGVPPTHTLIGTVAELHPNKGLSDLITTLPLLPDDVHLCIIGDGELRARLEAFADQLGVRSRISFLGFVPDAGSLIPGFDVFVLSSTKEGLPFVILEAGVSGVPIVATRVGGIPDVIDDGINGRIVPVHDCKLLAESVNAVLMDPATARARAQLLQEKIRAQFSFDTVTLPRTMALYSHVSN